MAIIHKRPFVEGSLKLKVENGRHFLYMPDGVTQLPKVIWTRVFDPCDDLAYVIAKFPVELIETEVTKVVTE